MANQAKLTALNSREAVADALQRCVLGIDTNNRDLFASAYLMNEDMAVVVGPTVIKGWDAISEFFERVFVMVTTHIISNLRVKLKDGADTASMSAHAISYHVKPEDAFKQEDTSYTASSLYAIDLIKGGSDGLCKIKRWDFQVLWTTGDRSILHG